MMRWVVAATSIAACLMAATANAAAYIDPQGVYTFELPDTWKVASVSPANGSAKLGSSEDALKGSSMMIGLAKRSAKTLEEDFLASGFGEVVGKIERDVTGVPCISAKQVVPLSEKPNAPALSFVMDRLWCSLKVEDDGKTENIAFIIMSTGGGDAYDRQHQAFEALIQALKWGSTVTAGQR